MDSHRTRRRHVVHSENCPAPLLWNTLATERWLPSRFGRFRDHHRVRIQQARFDKFIEVFNKERPHEALAMKCPADVYQASTRPYQSLPDIDYPFHDQTIVVTHCGRICLGRKKINFSTVFAGQAVGIKEVHDDNLAGELYGL